MGNERGITGLETAIILIAFVVVATVFAFVVLTTGIFSAERGKETVYAGLQKARGTLEVRGGVIVEADCTTPPCTVTDIKFDVANTAGGDPVPLNPGGTTNATIISYASGDKYNNNLTYTVNPIVGTDTNLLQPGDLDEIVITAADNADIASLAANDRWTLTVQTPVGAVVDVTRSMPAELSAVMQLH